MKSIILGGLAAGALSVLLCSSKAGDWARRVVRKLVPAKLKRHVDYLMTCTFCSSWWISLAMLEEFSIKEWAATVAIANITVLLIHWGLSTEEE